MSIATVTAPTTAETFETAESSDAARSKPLWRTGARAGIVAAVATTVVAAAALAADVPLEIGGEQIPLLGFAQMTLICTALGVLLAKAVRRWTARPQRAFVAATVALTALSTVPDLTADATTASKLVLIATHLIAAAIVVPALAQRLPDQAG
jgi:hypothetical protein